VDLPPELSLSVEDKPPPADRNAIDRALTVFNRQFLRNHSWARIGVFVRNDAGKVRAGLDGEVYAGWLFVRNLWVHADLRRRGIGRELMGQAERRALTLGCHSAWLDTWSFQAPGFYQRLGYEVFGTLDYPPDHRRFFLKKRLKSEAP
jgi:GNAT superfamily N-acetyltransferase